MPPLPLPMRSSAIASAVYEPETETLVVVFYNGRTATHTVSPAMVAAFVEAPSQGQFYNRYIKGS